MTTTEGRREGPEPSEKELTEELLRVLADLDALETSVVEQLADGADPDTYLAWARTTFPDLAPGLFEASGKPQDQVACALARKLWNVMPVEANGFEPVLMPDADPDALCPCGSSRTYGAGCSDFSLEIPIITNSLWPALVESRPSSHWRRLAKAGALPDLGLMYIAQSFHTSGAWRDIVDLLAPRVAAGGLAPDHCLDTMELLANSYRELEQAEGRRDHAPSASAPMMMPSSDALRTDVSR